MTSKLVVDFNIVGQFAIITQLEGISFSASSGILVSSKCALSEYLYAEPITYGTKNKTTTVVIISTLHFIVSFLVINLENEKIP